MRLAKKPRRETVAYKLKRAKAEAKEFWSAQVKKRDGHKCALCQTTEALHAHHWIVPAGRSLATRFIVDNGVTLCYVHHIIKIHKEACSETIDSLRRYMGRFIDQARYEQIQRLGHTTLDWGLQEYEDIRDGLRTGIDVAEKTHESAVKELEGSEAAGRG